MKDLFEPEDFCDIDFAAMDYAADVANKKLNKLIESWPVVYQFGNSWLPLNGTDATHKARLAFIEEIKKEPCKHEPEDGWFMLSSPTKCKHCGTQLQITWKESK